MNCCRKAHFDQNSFHHCYAMLWQRTGGTNRVSDILLHMTSSCQLQKRISLHDPDTAQSNQREDCVSNLSIAEHLKETKCKFLRFECSAGENCHIK